MSELDKTIEELEEEILQEMDGESSANVEEELDEMMKKEKMKKEISVNILEQSQKLQESKQAAQIKQQRHDKKIKKLQSKMEQS